MKSEKLDLTQTQIDAFWSKVEITDTPKSCWLWRGAKKPKGYGNVRINGLYLLAHRVAFELTSGALPEGFIVCHICDNPSCCNPSHLMLGTVKSNAADMLIKNRQKKKIYAARGEKNGNSKLSSKSVVSIRNLRNSGMKIKDIADKYRMSSTAISSVLTGETWSHVK